MSRSISDHDATSGVNASGTDGVGGFAASRIATEAAVCVVSYLSDTDGGIGNSTTVVLVATFRQPNFEKLPTVFDHDDRRVRRFSAVHQFGRDAPGVLQGHGRIREHFAVLVLE